MAFLWNAFYFIIALSILVTIHEFGHFWVARKLGVKVLTFSVGFGTPLWQRRGKDGVNYVIGAIPLGGYVKMLDEREGEVSAEERQFAFNQKSVWARIAIVLAGPMANFILAIFLFWWMFIMGISDLSTQVGKIEADSIAGKAGLVAGDVITHVDGEPVVLMQDLVKSVARRLGEKSDIHLKVESEDTAETRNIQLLTRHWQVDPAKPDILGSLGIRHKIHDLTVPPIFASVSPDGPAQKAGLMAGDIVKAFNNEPISSWMDLVKKIEPSSGDTVTLLIERNGELTEISVVIGSHERNGKTVGFIGVSAVQLDRSAYIVSRQGSFIESFELAIDETINMITLTSVLFKKLLTREISHKGLSGPFSIAKGAGGSARAGLVYFISFIAMISVNLGFINLLPIPVLDGGHLLFFSIEAIRGKPLSDNVQEIGMRIGMLLVFALMATAIFNDLRLF